MVNSGYRTLNNMTMGFTRASGAAQRVLSLMDAPPDIDVEAGRPLPPLSEAAIRRRMEDDGVAAAQIDAFFAPRPGAGDRRLHSQGRVRPTPCSLLEYFLQFSLPHIGDDKH